MMRHDAARQGVAWELGKIPTPEEVLSKNQDWESQVRTYGIMMQHQIDNN